MHNEETFRKLEASLAALKEVINEQRAVVVALRHERDLLAAGYVEAMKECEELKALLKASNDAEISDSGQG